jgi:hypothetical protein
MSPRQPKAAPSAVKLGSFVGKSKSDVMPGSAWPLSERKKPSKLPVSSDQRYEAIIDQLLEKLLFKVTSIAWYLCVGSSKRACSNGKP